VSKVYNQEEALKELMKEFEGEEPLTVNLNNFKDDDLDTKIFWLRQKGVPEDEIERMLTALQPTTLEDSVIKILKENKRISLKEIQERFASPVRKRAGELAIKHRPGIV